MKLAVFGENRFPVLPYGPGGLGRTTHMLAAGLLARGNDVTLHAIPGSEFPGLMKNTDPDPANYDAILDLSHDHHISRKHLQAPIENLICDRECHYVPPNAVVESHYMQKYYKGAKIVAASVDIKGIPFTEKPAGGYLLLLARMHPLKGVGDALKIHEITGVPVKFAGPDGDGLDLPDYLGPITDDAAKWDLLGNALVLLCPYYLDAAPRTPLEAAACGTPTLCYQQDGTKEHVRDGVTGFHCLNYWEMAEKIQPAMKLDRASIREWALTWHDLPEAVERHEKILMDIVGGKRW